MAALDTTGNAILRMHPRQSGAPQDPHYAQAVDRYGVQDLNNFDPNAIFRSERFQQLERAEQYYKCTQHDYKAFDWQGNQRPRGIVGVQAMTSSRATSNEYIPLDNRRPATPYRLGRKMVHAYTGLIFGGVTKFISNDPETQDYVEEIVKRASFQSRQNQVRNVGGSCGTGGLSWKFVNGMPRVKVHAGKFIHVIEWDDPDIYSVSHATELYQTLMTAYDPKEKKMVQKLHWCRCDWTPTADVVFEPKPVDEKDPRWIVDKDETIVHGDGYAHFIWVPNTPPSEPGTYDGDPDYYGLHEQLDTLDIVNSITNGGGIRNLDPTLLLKMNRDDVNGTVVRKGSTNALCVGEQGDARYLELSGTATQSGLELVKENRRQALECASCIVPDENAVTGAGTSSLTLKVLYAPMMNQGDIYRGQYGPAFERLLNQMLNSARRLAGMFEDVSEDGETAEDGVAAQAETIGQGGAEADAEGVHVLGENAFAKEQADAYGDGSPEVEDEDAQVEPDLGGEMQRAYYIDLEPRIERKPVLDDAGEPTGDETIEEFPRTPGTGTVTIEWPEYFPPTSDDEQKEAQTVGTLVGAKPVVSQQSAVERVARRAGADPVQEWGRVLAEQKRATAAQEAGMFPGAGGPVDDIDGVPDGVPAQTRKKPAELPALEPPV